MQWPQIYSEVMRGLKENGILCKIVERRVKWAGHMVRMKDERLPKISETKKQADFIKRGDGKIV